MRKAAKIMTLDFFVTYIPFLDPICVLEVGECCFRSTCLSLQISCFQRADVAKIKIKKCTEISWCCRTILFGRRRRIKAF